MPPSLGQNAYIYRTLLRMSVGRNADGHRDYHYLGLQEPMPMRLGQNANMPLAIQAHA